MSSTLSEYQSYSPSKAHSQAYRTKSPKYADHRDVTYNTTLSPYKTPNRDSAARALEEVELSESLSASKIRLDNQVKDIKTLLDSKFNPETNLWKTRWHESESRKSFLEGENLRLAREIEFWRSKSNATEIERATILLSSSALRASQLDSLRLSTDTTDLALRLEAEKLRDILTLKIQECNDIKANYSKLELLTVEARGKDEVAQDYEARILRLKSDYADRLREVDELRNQKTRHELDNYELVKAQQEAEALKALLEAKKEENSRIRREKTEIEVENYKTKKAENVLLEKEALLKSQLEDLESEASKTEDLRKSAYLEKSQVHQQETQNLQETISAEQAEIENQVNETQRLAAEKLNEIERLRAEYNNLNTDLSKAEDQQTLADIELNAWKERAAQAERLKEAEVARAARLKEASVSLTTAEIQREKQQLEERVDVLGQVVSHKEADLNKVQEQVNLTEAEKAQLAEERAELLAQVDELLKKQRENDDKFKVQAESRENQHSSSLERVRKEHDNESRRITNQISALRTVIDNKRDEADRARREANEFQLRLINCERKATAAEVESGFWKNATDRVARQKTLESEVERSVTASQLRDLERVQSIEKLQKQREAENLRTLLNVREREASDLRTSASLTASQVTLERQERARLQVEADLNRARALDAETSKLAELRLRESIHNDTVDALRRSALLDTSVLRTEASILTESLIRKEREAREWRDTVARLSRSPVRRY